MSDSESIVIEERTLRKQYKKAKDLHDKALDILRQETKQTPEVMRKAFRLFEQSARLGSAESMYILSHFYREPLIEGEGDLELSFKWALEAANNGHVEAMNTVGACLVTGEGVESSFEQAIYWYQKVLTLVIQTRCVT